MNGLSATVYSQHAKVLCKSLSSFTAQYVFILSWRLQGLIMGLTECVVLSPVANVKHNFTRALSWFFRCDCAKSCNTCVSITAVCVCGPLSEPFLRVQLSEPFLRERLESNKIFVCIYVVPKRLVLSKMSIVFNM